MNTFTQEVELNEHYMTIAPEELTHRAHLCVCQLVRDEDAGSVRLHHCPMHENAPDLLAALERLANAVKAHRETFTTVNLIELAEAEDNANETIAKARRQEKSLDE